MLPGGTKDPPKLDARPPAAVSCPSQRYFAVHQEALKLFFKVVFKEALAEALA